MNAVINIFVNLFQVACFVMAVNMTYSQIKTYQRNTDVSVVTYQSFNQEPRDTYPTISICALSVKYLWLTQQMISQILTNFKVNGTNMTADNYHNMMAGHANPTGDFHKIQFDDVKFDFMIDPQVLEMFNIELTNNSYIDEINNPTWQSMYSTGPMYVSYEDPYAICISKEFRYMPNTTFKTVTFTLNLQPHFVDMLGTYGYLYLYLHDAGQLIRSMSKPQIKLSSRDLQNIKDSVGQASYKWIALHFNKMERIQKRPNANVPCDVDNDDIHYLATAVQLTRCIPAYWKRFVPEMTAIHFADKEDCTNRSQYKLLNNEYLPTLNKARGFQTVAMHYKKPCIESTYAVANEKKQYLLGSSLRVTIDFNTESYLNIENTEAFDVESMWSAIGGFIGIFLGYSMLQVPQLVLELLEFLKKRYQECAVKKHSRINKFRTGTNRRAYNLQTRVAWENSNIECTDMPKVSVEN